MRLYTRTVTLFPQSRLNLTTSGNTGPCLRSICEGKQKMDKISRLLDHVEAVSASFYVRLASLTFAFHPSFHYPIPSSPWVS